MRIAIVGIGLIGGSMALVLRQKGITASIIGVDSDPRHCEQAVGLGIVDDVKSLEEAIRGCDFIILSTPVGVSPKLLSKILDLVDQQVVMDTGSVKYPIVQEIGDHPKRGRFVATHPMWGTENKGPEAATLQSFAGKATVICEDEKSDPDAVEKVCQVYNALGMYTVYMDSAEHDLHVAYISHISHITSFALANTVLEKEREEDAIFELASAGFESTVRLAKSNPDMWLPIFQQNKENILDVLNEHIAQLRKFKSCLEKENWAYLYTLMEHANKIKKILNPQYFNRKTEEK